MSELFSGRPLTDADKSAAYAKRAALRAEEPPPGGTRHAEAIAVLRSLLIRDDGRYLDCGYNDGLLAAIAALEVAQGATLSEATVSRFAFALTGALERASASSAAAPPLSAEKIAALRAVVEYTEKQADHTMWQHIGPARDALFVLVAKLRRASAEAPGDPLETHLGRWARTVLTYDLVQGAADPEGLAADRCRALLMQLESVEDADMEVNQ